MRLKRFCNDLIGVLYRVYYISNSLYKVNNIRLLVGRIISKRRSNGILYFCLLVRYGKDYSKLNLSTLSPYILFIEPF
ncbi:hypothetical protein [Candidatus Vidania fulgoroideorum]